METMILIHSRGHATFHGLENEMSELYAAYELKLRERIQNRTTAMGDIIAIFRYSASGHLIEGHSLKGAL